MDGEIVASEANETKEAYWQRILQDWKLSGLKACEFQRQKNLSKHAFVYWKLKLIGPTEKKQALVPVRVRSSVRPSARSSCIRLRVGELFSVELVEGFDAQTLREVLAVVRECAE